jgi:uncharacterized protein (TIRG00374 family)
VLKVVFSILLIGVLLKRIGVGKIAGEIGSASLFWIVGALILFTASHLLGSFQWMKLLSFEGIRISWRKTVSFYFIGLFFNNFFISSMGGDLFRIMDVRRYSRNGVAAVSTVFLDRFMGLLVLSGLAVLASPWILIKGNIRAHIALPVVILIVGWILVLLLFFNKRFAFPFSWLIKKAIPARVSVKARAIYRKIYYFSRQRTLFIKIVMLSLIIQSARIMTHYLLSRSLGVSISAGCFFLVVPLIAIMATLPVSLGGIGLREQTGVVLFGAFGMAESQAFSTEFLAYLVAVCSSLPGGILFMVRKKQI